MPDLSHISCAILAGGLGTRLRDLVADRPKGLALIRGRPFLAWQLDQLAAAGVRNVTLCTGHMAELVETTLGAAHGPIRLTYSRETMPLGTGGALALAAGHLASDPVLVLNGDSYCRVDFAAFLRFHESHVPAPSLLLTRVPDIARFGQVVTDASHRVTRFAEKGAPTSPPQSGYINAGVYLLPRSLVAAIPSGRAVSLERETFPAAIASGLFAYSLDAPFIDIGTPDSYRAADAFFGQATQSNCG